MGLFDWFRTGKKRDDSPTELWERQLKLEADQRALRREWENTHDSIVRTLAKIGRREKRAAEAEADGPSDRAAEGPESRQLGNHQPFDPKERFRLNNLRR